jgi:hypothetical protein
MKNTIKSVLMIPAMVLALVSAAQVPVLSSLPSAPSNTPTILLDFDGYTVSGTSWNLNGPIVCQAATLNSTQITEIFNRVAEDYRPFKVNVTTDETKFNAAPATKRMRVLLTITNSWYGNGAGGVAFIGSFTWGDDTPCFVFTALLNNNVKFISEAASHECGHTLGLFHQAVYDANCNYVSDYNSGTGSGEIGWAPIMGVGYYRNTTTWYIGPNPNGCNQIQNDMNIILAAANGIVYRTDDFSSSFSQASNQTFSNNQFTTQGIIEKDTDQDMFKFTMPVSGRLVLNAAPYNVGAGDVGSNLDIQVTLFDNAQTQLGIYNPASLLSASVDTFLNAGAYYLRVEGKGNIYVPDYASLGSYSLQGNFTTGNPLPLRRLELTGSLNGNKHQLNWIIDADEQVTDLALEISTDGRNFGPLYQADAQARAFAYTPFNSNSVQYRLNVTFDNGRQYYSNVVSLRGAGVEHKPQLAGNILYTNTITVSSPGTYQYTVHDMNGRIVTHGNISSGVNKITSANLVNGMYLIRFTGEEGEWIEKFIRQ